MVGWLTNRSELDHDSVLDLSELGRLTWDGVAELLLLMKLANPWPPAYCHVAVRAQ